jgi:hypothetical protein
MPGTSFQGWTLLEALERTADPALWQACAAAKSEWERVRTPIPSAPNAFFHHSPEKIVALLQKYREADSLLYSHFWQLLVDQKLIAYGSRNGSSEIPTLIHAAGWDNLAWPKRENSTVKERSSARTKIYNVRVFPVLQSPEAPMLLDGFGLGEAFRRYIIEDPEVIALGKLVGTQGGNRAVFEEGNASGRPYGSFHWSLGLSAKDLAWEFVRPIIFFVSSPLPEPSPEISKASIVLADRCQALQRLLVTGRIGAIGTFAQTGETRPIDRMQWQRAGISVEIRNSDLCEMENHRPAVRWSGISLELPARTTGFVPADNVVAVNSVAVNSVREAKKMTAVQASIGEAVKALWPDGVPQSLQLQQRDNQIIEWQRENKRVVVSQKSIRRYLSPGGQFH